MPKRRRQPDEARDEGDLGKRRRKSTHYDAVEMCQELYDSVRNLKSDDGRTLCESFIRAPKRRNSADYYEIVATPIDLLKIQQKIKTDDYEDVEQMSADVELMVSNAKSYYKKSSQEYKDAVHLLDLFTSSKQQLMSSMAGAVKEDSDNDMADSSNDTFHEVISITGHITPRKGLAHTPTNNEDDNPYEELFSTVLTASDLDGRVYSTSVQLLPSQRQNPVYYKTIQEPMDLKMIATKIQKNKYQNLTELENDLLLIVKNVKAFNPPASQMYKDGVALRRIITSKKLEIEHGRATGSKTSERIRQRRLAGGQRLSAITAALQYESEGEENQQEEEVPEEEEDDGDGGSDTKDVNSPLWQLYESLCEYTSPQGYQLSEPFMRLPSRRLYPDYYKEIKRPISLLNIRTKIKNGLYTGVTDMVDDLNIMFENARSYNRADSKIFKDAVKLQKIMQTSATELINLEKRATEPLKETATKGSEANESDEDENSNDKTFKRRGRKPLNPEERKKGTCRRGGDTEIAMKKRMKILYRSISEYMDEAGRPLITFFMEKPSKKNYPDYYQVIAEPIDMKAIIANIRNDKYESEEALISDFHLMFRNCRQYNEENSQIYHDAVTLEKVLMDKVQELASDSPKLKIIARKSKVKASPQMTQRLRTLFDTIKDYNDKGRKLSPIFQKLPSRSEYPDYYEVIKKPIDLTKIHTRLNSGHYENLEDMLSDFVQMFDNACKYNEPDSQIYKDALTLQRVALQSKMELSEDDDGSIPDVKPLVQELLTSLFTYVYNHEDEESRCYSDSLAELSETRAAAEQEATRMLTLDMIKRNLDKGRYRRLDAFQDDVFEVFETARRISRTDSQVFEDSVELHSYFIKMRDELCRNGEILSSPAQRYTEREMLAGVECLKAEKLPLEKSDDEKDKDQDNRAEKEHRSSQNNSDSVHYREQTYHVGDFVYIEPREKGLEAHIIHIEKLWKDDQGEQWLYGCWFYRPNETFHLATRKFLEKEVFKSDNYNNAPMSQVLGKCYVMFVKDYFKFMPEGLQEKDVYVCESRYSAKAKAFKKIKIWPPIAQHVHIIPRDVSLIPTRVPSIFKDRIDKHKEDNMDLDDFTIKGTEKEKPNVVATDVPAEENLNCYEQFNIPTGRYKLGDCVYVRSENGRQLIARIDKMWEDKSSGSFFHGPWFVTPQEITHPPTRLFHKQEVFLSSIEDTNPLLSITGRCHVMELKDYVRCRPTEIPEQDVYVCESRYLEAERQIRKLTKGLMRFQLSPFVTEDEIYFFKKPISTQKTEHGSGSQGQVAKVKPLASSEPSPLLLKVSDVEMEDSNDGQAPSVGSSEPATPNPSTSVKKKPLRRIVTGYILYAGETRKSIIMRNPDATFGDISRMVGTEWRGLPAELKADYEERAQKLNEETASHQPVLIDPSQLMPLPENTVFECQWEKCDFQFEDQQDLAEHLIGEGTGHVHVKYADANDFQCLWNNCARMKKNMAPFQNIQRLVRHCREVHIIKSSGRMIPPTERGKNYVPSRRSLAGSRPQTPGVHPVQGYPASRFPHQPSLPNISSQPVPLGVTPHPQYSTPDLTFQLCASCMHHMPCQCLLTYSSINIDLSYERHALYSMLDLPPDADNDLFENSGVKPLAKPKSSADPKDKAKIKRKQGQGKDEKGPAPSKPADPMFVAVPQRPLKLLHSEAYLRYIEGLQPENRMISNWDSNLRATQENTPLQDSGRLPVHWLGNGIGNHGNAVNALWALRDYMMKDALSISKVLW